MPYLVGFMDPAPDAPGFLIALFRDQAGSNFDLTQIIGHKETILGFRQVIPPGKHFLRSKETRLVEIGKPAVWAFKDHHGSIHLGTGDEMSAVAKRLLGHSGLSPWPLVRLELGFFRDRNRFDPELLLEAFRSVQADDGDVAAEVWRDTEVFSPAVRRDVHKHNGGLSDTVGSNLVVMHIEGHLQVFVESRIAPLLDAVGWSETRYALEIFKLEGDVVVRELKEFSRKDAARLTWRAIGVGGVARFVLGAKPFNGRPCSPSGKRDKVEVVADGDLPPSLGRSTGASQFFSVCQSLPGQVELVAAEVGAYPPEPCVRHLVNVRPFSFGSPSPRTTPVLALSELGREFDHIWIVAGHRQRRTGRFASQLSVTNTASRIVRTLLLSLQRRADLVSHITAAGLANIPSLNLFGALRGSSDWSMSEWIRQILYTMLAEEALLYTAQRIVALVPGNQTLQEITVRIAGRRYKVELFPDPGRNRSPELIGWAIGVDPALRTADELAELCIGLLERYGWQFLGREDAALLFKNEGELLLRVWPAHDPTALEQSLEEPSLEGCNDLIITWLTVRAEWRRRATDLERSLIHYSDLGRWFAGELKQPERFVRESWV